MAFFKCALCICSLLCASVAVVESKDVAIIAAPGGPINYGKVKDPFSIGHQQKSVNPLAKIIEMVTGIKKQVQEEHKDEAVIYDNFACFCKDKTDRLETHVHFHGRKIDEYSADIEYRTARSNELNSEVQERKSNEVKMSTELDETKQRLREENNNWNNLLAEFENNRNVVAQALNALKGSKNIANSRSAFLQMPGIAKIKKELEIADAMGLFEGPKQKAIAGSLLQDGTHANQTAKSKQHGNPMESYGYHSGSDDIIDLVEDLMGQLRDLHEQQTKEHVKADSAMRDMIDALDHKLHANKRAIQGAISEEAFMQKRIGHDRKDLIENQQDMLDTEDVLKEVTSACEARAEEYNKRTNARRAELTALNAALVCLSNAHKGAVKEAQALLQGKAYEAFTKSKSLPKPNHTAITEVKASEKNGTEVKAKALEKVVAKPVSFLQELQTQGSKASFLSRGDLSPDERKKKALGVILSEGKRIKSLMLTSIAAKLPDDPFAKVKQLLSDLRFRLEREENEETNKQVFCVAKIEETVHERDLRFQQAKDNSAEALSLKASIEDLKQKIAYYANKAAEAEAAMTQIFTDTSQLSKEQLKTMQVQKEARDEIREAIQILKSYYSQAASSTNSKRAWSDLLQLGAPTPAPTINDIYRGERQNIREENERRQGDEEVRAEDRDKRARKRIGDLEGEVPSLGRAGSMADALGLMEAIADDFDQEIRNLQGDLSAEHQELVAVNKVLLSQKMKADELQMLSQQDMETATIKHKQAVEDLQTAMDLLDLALKEYETLKPTCIDTGMSYADRVQKRKDEMCALRKALCILGETDKKFGCPKDSSDVTC